MTSQQRHYLQSLIWLWPTLINEFKNFVFSCLSAEAGPQLFPTLECCGQKSLITMGFSLWPTSNILSSIPRDVSSSFQLMTPDFHLSNPLTLSTPLPHSIGSKKISTLTISPHLRRPPTSSLKCVLSSSTMCHTC